jgi:hypothetical protein
LINIAFPATYNISYYRGDSYNFVINPKNPNGTSFNLAGFSGLFTISTERGNPAAEVATGTAIVNSEAATVTCEIPDSLGSVLSGASYLYDIEVNNSSASTTFTLLTGTISVTQDISRTGQ